MHIDTAHIGQTQNSWPRVWLQKMPSQIQIANRLHCADIFQLDARKGQAPYLKARVGGEAMVTTEIWQLPLSLFIYYQPGFLHFRGDSVGQEALSTDILYGMLSDDMIYVSAIHVIKKKKVVVTVFLRFNHIFRISLLSSSHCITHNKWKQEAVSKTNP